MLGIHFDRVKLKSAQYILSLHSELFVYLNCVKNASLRMCVFLIG